METSEIYRDVYQSQQEGASIGDGAYRSRRWSRPYSAPGIPPPEAAATLILDDSTSAVDTATDAKIRAAFRTQLPDTTKIIIAQRIISVMDADLIVVMDDGRVADAGTHEELMETSEIYREFWRTGPGGWRGWPSGRHGP